MRKNLTKTFWNIEVWAVQKHVNLVDLVKSFPTNIYLQNLASIQNEPLKVHSIFKLWDFIFTEPPSPSESFAGSAAGSAAGPAGVSFAGLASKLSRLSSSFAQHLVRIWEHFWEVLENSSFAQMRSKARSIRWDQCTRSANDVEIRILDQWFDLQWNQPLLLRRRSVCTRESSVWSFTYKHTNYCFRMRNNIFTYMYVCGEKS